MLHGHFRRISEKLCSQDHIAPGVVYNTGNSVPAEAMAHVKSLEKNAFRMSDGAMIKFSMFNRSKILKAWEKYSASKITSP